MLTIPILMNHEHDKCVGVVRFTQSGVLAEFHEAVTREQFFAIFGNVGFQMLDGEFSTGPNEVTAPRIKRAQILCWSSGVTAAFRPIDLEKQGPW